MLAYLDCFSGISGDMLLGAMLDAGLDLGALRDGLASLPLGGYKLSAERVTDRGITGTRAIVELDASADAGHRRLGDISALLDAGALPERARATAREVFRRLAEAEAAIHGATPDEVTFHEVGAVDSIVDIAGAALGFELLGVDALYCSDLPLTTGRVMSAHGSLPVPAPATLELLRNTGASWRPVPAEGELVTPTGAAILAVSARFERPATRVRSVGYGFGTRQLPWANCLRLVLGDEPALPSPPSFVGPDDEPALPSPPQWGGAGGRDTDFERDEISVLESNVDNMTGEALGWLMERLLAAGALDVAYSPLQMKKNRPATLLTVLALPTDADRLAGVVLRESGTLGVRIRRAERIKAGRREEEIETPLGAVRVKLKLVGGQVIAASPEYDDCRAIAQSSGLPLETVVAQVTHAARIHFGLV